jgi:stage II sporulation protein M
MSFLLHEKKLFSYSISILILSILSGALLQKLVLGQIFDTGVTNPEDIDHWWFYFKNNSITCLIIISGIFIYAITTLFSLVFNGFLIGIALVSVSDQGASIGEILAALLPHGVFEMPALIIASMIGLKGFSFYKKEKDKNYYIKLGKLVGLVLLLLLFASFIEAYITVPFEPKGI